MGEYQKKKLRALPVNKLERIMWFYGWQKNTQKRRKICFYVSLTITKHMTEFKERSCGEFWKDMV